MPLRNIDDLKVFMQVVESKSFSAAARQTNSMPKTVSKQIARLEAALGITLFERNTRNVRITDEGRAIAERAKLALEIFDEIQELADNKNQELSGIIRLTAPTPFGRKYLTSAIHDFCKNYPKVSFDLRLSDEVQDLFSGDFDLAIRMGDLADSRLVARKISDNRRILVASAAYLSAHEKSAHEKLDKPEDLVNHNCLIFVYPGLLQNIWSLRREKESKAIPIKGNLSSDNGDVLHQWCLMGLGISLRETWDIVEELKTGQLQRVLPEWEAIPSKISIVRPKREITPARLRVFIDYLHARWKHAPWELI